MNIIKNLIIITFISIFLLLIIVILFRCYAFCFNDVQTNNITMNTMQMNNIPIDDVKENAVENKIFVNTVTDDVISNTLEQNVAEDIQIKDEKPEEVNHERKFNSNVAFIGDSRTQAFLMYAGLNNVTDYTNIGLMVNTAMTKAFITNDDGKKITILEDLKNKKIDTIYIMLGINELGWVYSNIFINEYEKLIDSILEIKPNCEIIVQSIIPVTKTKSDNDSVYNNKRINEYNKLIKEMTDRKKIKFIDLVPVLADKNGNLPENASPDGIHLNKEYCVKWYNCLKNN